MSEDPKDKTPSKLKLSRDVKNAPETEVTKTQPSVKLKHTVDAERNTASPAAPTPAPTPEQAPAPAQTAADASAPSVTAPSADITKKGFDPKNPFGNATKDDEISQPTGEPTELPSPPAPSDNDEDSARIEAAVNSLNATSARPLPVPQPAKTSIVPSLIIILLLMLILFGAGFGLWKLLQSSDSSTAAAPSQPAQTSQPPSPIQRAKEAVSKVPLADVDAIIATQQSPALAQTPALAQAAAGGDTRPPAPPAAASAPTIQSAEAVRASVSKYLSSVHIGGLRQGERPMVIIEGQTFLVGDTVQPETGLKFDGMRDGRLAFRDTHGIVYLKSF